MARDFTKRIFNLANTGTVLCVLPETEHETSINTDHNAIRLMVKLDNAINFDNKEQYEIAIVETNRKELADIMTTPKEGSKISFKGTASSPFTTKGYGRLRKTYRMRKHPVIMAQTIFNTKPAANFGAVDNPIYKMALKMADNNLTAQDAFVVVHKTVQNPDPILVEVVVAKNRKDALKQFMDNPINVAQLNNIRQHVEIGSKANKNKDFFNTVKMIRLNFKKPVIHWTEFSSHFERQWENVML
jgi:hypothetical protein